MKGRRLDVQGLRAVAILMVVAFHADIGLTGGFTGVDVFFAVSGFVITGTLVRELERSDRIDLPAFYRRRVKRLLPGLAAMLTFVGLAGMMLAPVAAVHVSAVTGMAASVFAANFYLYSLPHGYFDVSSNLDPLLHTWTLAVEEQFYLVYPLALLAAWRLGRRSARPSAARGVAILVVVAACAVSVLLAERWSTHAGALAFYASPARAWEFGAGCLVALLAPLWARTPQRVCFGLAAAGAAAIVVAATSAGDNGAVLRDLGLPVAGTCLLMAGGARPNRVTELLARRPFVALGDLSYSWYLWHWPVIVFARAIAPGNSWAAAAGAVVSLAPAWASYLFLENPIRFKARIVGRRALVLAAVCIEVPLAAALVQLHVPLATASAGISVPGREPVRACSAELSSTQRPRCTWLAPRARGTVVLVGDSNAGHFAEPVVAAARRAHLNVTAAVQSGCPFLSLRFANGSLDYRPCMHANRVFLSWLLSTRPSLVIVGMRSDEMIADPAWGLAAGNGTPIHTAVGKTRLMALGLRSEIVALSRVGVPVLVVHPVPEVGVDRGVCAVLLLLNGRCFTSRSRALVDRALRRTLAAEQLALRGLRSGSLLDVENDLCTTTRCPSARNGVSLYADNFHLSMVGASTLTPAFYKAIAARATELR